jgi:hypothetical protein
MIKHLYSSINSRSGAARYENAGWITAACCGAMRTRTAGEPAHEEPVECRGEVPPYPVSKPPEALREHEADNSAKSTALNNAAETG